VQQQVIVTSYPVHETRYSIHWKRGETQGSPRSLRVDYRIGWNQYKSEWICLEHMGYARHKAEAWWRKRTQETVPTTVEEAMHLANEGLLREVRAITVRSVAGERFDRIVGYEFIEAGRDHVDNGNDNVPF
jgi:DNA repair protein RadD